MKGMGKKKRNSGGSMRPNHGSPGAYKPEGRGGPTNTPKGSVKRKTPV